MIPELPLRRVAPRREAPRVRRSSSSSSSKRPGRATVVQLVAVGVIDLVLILAMFHPALTRSVFASLPMTITVLTLTVTTATSGGGA